MKKFSAILMALAIAVSFASCAGKAEPEASTTEPEITQPVIENTTAVIDTAGLNDSEKALAEKIECKTENGYAYFTVKTAVELNVDNAWLGICPEGVYYTELQADDADVYYSYMENGEDYADAVSKGVYTFKYDLNSIEKGTYSMVLCDSDDEGRLVGQWLFSIDDSKKITLSFKDSRLAANEDELSRQWVTAEFPMPEGCVIRKVEDVTDGKLYRLKWDSRDAMKKYISVLAEMGDGDGKPSFEDKISCVYNTINLHVSFNEKDESQNDILIYTPLS